MKTVLPIYRYQGLPRMLQICEPAPHTADLDPMDIVTGT